MNPDPFATAEYSEPENPGWFAKSMRPAFRPVWIDSELFLAIPAGPASEVQLIRQDRADFGVFNSIEIAIPTIRSGKVEPRGCPVTLVARPGASRREPRKEA
jgi:hypothetical protein